MIITYEISDYKWCQKEMFLLRKKKLLNLKKLLKEKKIQGVHIIVFQKESPDNWFVQDGFLFPINVEYTTTHSFDYDDHLVGKLKKISDKGE